MKYNFIGFMLGRKCTASCKSCCFSSGPSCTEEIDTSIVKKYISSSSNIDTIKTISFSGGEAFLYYDKLKDLIKSSVNAGKQSTVITNGFWATDIYETRKKLQELKETGLTAIGISYDEFHQEYISIRNIKNIINAAKSLSLHVSIQTIIVKDSISGGWIDSLGEDLADIKIEFMPCYPIGEAKEHIKKDNYIRSYSSDGCYCRKGSTYSVLYDGSIWPCCSPYVFETELSVGNIGDIRIDVKSTLKALQKSNILYMLRNYGFDYFVDIAKNKLDISVPERIISSCELCALFFCKENIHKFIPHIFRSIHGLKQNIG